MKDGIVVMRERTTTRQCSLFNLCFMHMVGVCFLWTVLPCRNIHICPLPLFIMYLLVVPLPISFTYLPFLHCPLSHSLAVAHIAYGFSFSSLPPKWKYSLLIRIGSSFERPWSDAFRAQFYPPTFMYTLPICVQDSSLSSQTCMRNDC